MTNSNKSNILEYISGNFTPTNPSDAELSLETKDSTMYNYFNGYVPTTYSNFRIEGIIAPNEMTTSLGVMYGGYIQDDNVYGIIILINDKFEPVKTFYEYDSGTKLRYIQYMKQAEDGTFYFIDDEVSSYSQKQEVVSSQKRFVMVNNFTIQTDTYHLRLRTTYIFPDAYKNFYCKNMYKDANSSHYIFFGSVPNPNNSYNYDWLRIIGLKVNVGMPNEWTMYADQVNYIFGSAIATFDGENVRYRCLATWNNSNSRTFKLFSKTYTGTPISNDTMAFSYRPYIDDFDYKKQSVFIDYDNVYLVQNNQQWGITGVSEPKYIGLYKYNIPNDEITTYYEKYLGDYDRCNLEAIYIDKHDTDLYLQYNTNIASYKADYYYQRLGNKWKPILKNTQQDFYYNQRSIFVKSNFNLLQICMYATAPNNRYLGIVLEDYNPQNYNSIPYIDYDSMIPRKAVLYGLNGVLFARNLYNKTIFGNMTTSTIQIPYNYLNDVQIKNKLLESNTNQTIDLDTSIFTKNIYENVLLNFIDTILVKDDDEELSYPSTANYITQNINIGTKVNYDSTKITKVRLNYQDGSQIIPISWSGSTVKQTQFTIYISSTLRTIDFMNEDENFVYITKTYNNLVVGKYYTISQKLKIE